MTQRTALITGANGGIGQVLCRTFREAGWRVVSSDRDETSGMLMNSHVVLDLARVCRDEQYRQESFVRLRDGLPLTGLNVLINNAAVQIVEPVEKLTADNWQTTMDVNLIAPFLLTQAVLPDLEKAGGSVINIASIHANLTKPCFSAYATSKSALIGLTRSLAVELGGRVRVNAVSPAAIDTPMLRAGFEGNPNGLINLGQFHPSGMIGKGRDVAQAALYLAEVSGHFLTGAVIGIDGGIASRLHDPE